jgi:hypothetical protein
MKIKSIIITLIVFAIMASAPLFSSLAVKRINNRPVKVYEKEIVYVEMKEVSTPVSVNLLYRKL